MTLTDFLLARIAEDEAGQAGGHDYWCSWSQASEPCDCPRKRIMAECEAKRRIVEMYHEAGVAGSYPRATVLGPVARALALPYADHLDYREEWRP